MRELLSGLLQSGSLLLARPCTCVGPGPCRSDCSEIQVISGDSKVQSAMHVSPALFETLVDGLGDYLGFTVQALSRRPGVTSNNPRMAPMKLIDLWTVDAGVFLSKVQLTHATSAQEGETRHSDSQPILAESRKPNGLNPSSWFIVLSVRTGRPRQNNDCLGTQRPVIASDSVIFY